MSHQARDADFVEQARKVLLATENDAELLKATPELLRQYAGQWVASQGGHVVAHSRDGAELARIANIRDFPNVVIRYVPTLEEQAGVFIL